MRFLMSFLLLLSGSLFASDIRLDAEEGKPARSGSPELSAAGAEKAEALADFAAFIQGVISRRDGGKTKLPEAVLDHLYRALEKDPGSNELMALAGADLSDQQGELPARVKRLMEFAKKHPGNISLNVLLASQLVRTGRKADRERVGFVIDLIDATWKAGKGNAPDSPEMQRLLSARMLQALLLASREEFGKADEVIGEVLERVPERRRPEALQSAMSVYLEAQKKASDETPFLIGFLMESDKEKFSRKFEEVSREFIHLLSQPGVNLDPEKFLTSAAIFEREGKTDYALLVLTRPLYANPDQLGALRRLAAFYYSEKQFANAARLWRRIVELGGGRTPMDSYLHALSLLRAGDAPAAVKAFEDHYKRFPNDVKSLNQYVLAAWLAEEYERIPEIVNAIPAPPPDFLYLKGRSEQILKRYGDALETMLKYEGRRKWENEERLSAFRIQLVLLADKAKRLDVAERILLPMLEKDPKNPELLNLLGYLYADAGVKLEKAGELLENALRADPKNPAILDSMAWMLYRRKEFGKAADYIQKALTAGGEPADPVILDHAGDIFSATGEKQKALEFWKRSLEYFSPDVDPARVLEKIRNTTR